MAFLVLLDEWQERTKGLGSLGFEAAIDLLFAEFALYKS